MQDDTRRSSAPPVPEDAAPGSAPPDPAREAARDPSTYQGEERESILLQPPTVELPKGGGAIQSIGETFKVNAATGTNSTSVPLALTPSRGGAQPGLQLSYDSGAGNGPFGLGWNVGIASISRRTEKGLPTYRDGGPGGSEDTFMLTGAEELVPALKFVSSEWVEDTFTAQDDDSVDWDVRRYRPRTEGGFSLIERWTKQTDPNEVFWRTQDRSNTVRLFGKSASARVVDPQDTTRIFRWLLERVEDERGNRVLYTYRSENMENVVDAVNESFRMRGPGVDLSDSDPDNRSYGCTWVYPDRVFYGNKSTTPAKWIEGDADQAATDWMFSVVFDYGGRAAGDPEHDTADVELDWSARSDPFSTFKAGFDQRCYRLCERVIVFHYFPDEDSLHPDSTVGPPDASFWVPVKSTELTYSQTAALTTLTDVVHRGWKWNTTNTEYDTLTTPGISYSYTSATLDPSVKPVAGLDDLAPGVDPRAMQWVDLDGEGLTGMLTEAGGSWFYKRNEGNGTFAPRRELLSRPSLGLGGHQLQDVDRDGRLELVRMTRPAAGYHTREEDGPGWEGFRTFDELPNLDWSDPNLRQLDLDGDGLPDVLITRDQVFTWYRSKGTEGYESARQTFPGTDEDLGPTLVFGNDSESIFLADMSGDGLTDIVRIRNGSVCYWPNLGHGRFAAKITLASSPRFDSEECFDPKRLKLADIDGSGPTDLVYVGPDAVHYWFNQSGNSFSATQTIPGFPGISDAATVSVTDLLGTGTACLVWSSPLLSDAWQPLRYVDLMASGKPHLLSVIDNNRGREVRFTYAASTKFYLADRQAGTPWATKLHFPVQVVEKVESVDHITGWRFVQQYAYHHGFYDGVEREFRGFGMVETTDTETVRDFEDADLSDADIVIPPLDPVRMKTWFHTGTWRRQQTLTAAYEAEYWSGDTSLGTSSVVGEPTLPAGLDPEDLREAARVLRGQALRVEVFADDGDPNAANPYTVTETTWEVRQIQPPQGNDHGVYHVVPGPSRASHYERNATDPRVAMTYPLVIDAYGTTTRSAVVSFPRRSASTGPQSEAHVVVSENLVIHDDAPTDHLDSYHLAVPYKSQTWELLEVTFDPTDDTDPPTASEIDGDFTDIGITTLDFEESLPQTPSGIYKRELSHVQIDYWNDGLTAALSNGTLGKRVLVHQTYQKVFTAGMLSDTALYNGQLHDGTGTGDSLDLDLAGYDERTTGEWWIKSGRQFPDASEFYQPTAYVDPYDVYTEVDYDGYSLLITEVRQGLVTGASPSRTLDTSVDIDTIDYRLLAPTKITDPNGQPSLVEHDILGRVTKIALDSKVSTEGDDLTNPTQEFTYADTEWSDNVTATSNGLPNYVHAKHRKQHGGTASWQESYTYSDGGGGVVQVMVQAEDGDVPQRDSVTGELVYVSNVLQWTNSTDRWVGTGRTVVDNKGNPVLQYEPFFKDGREYEVEKDLVEWGVSPYLQYDPVGQNIRTDFPHGTHTRVVFDPWKQETWDENDTADEDHYDGTTTTWYDERKALTTGDPERRAADLVDDHLGTPTTAHFDALGRAYETDAHNGFDTATPPNAILYTTTITLDVSGNPTTINDAIDNDTQVQHFDMIGRPIKTVSLDAGDTIVFPDASGQPLHVWKSGDLQIRNTYDARRRLLKVEAEDGASAGFVLHEYFLYGDALTHANDATRVSDDNLKGRLFRVYDGGGLHETASYDFKGNALETVRTFLDDPTTVTDWASASGGSPSVSFPNAVTIADYDDAALNELSTGANALEFTTTTVYDALNRVTEQKSPEAPGTTGDTRNTTLYTYNDAGLLETVKVKLRGSSTETGFVDAIAYDAQGRRESIDYANGVTTTYTYDALSKRLTRLKSVEGSDVYQDITYVYDAVGNIVEIDDGTQDTVYFDNTQVDPKQEFTYDALYRLIEAKGREKTSMGQPSSSGYGSADVGFVTLGAQNTLLQNYTRAYTYDAVGNILTMSTGTGGWTRTYTYEEDVSNVQISNKLVSHTIPGAGGPAQFTYNDRGAMDKMHHTGTIVRNYRDQIRKLTMGSEDGYYAYDSGGQRVRKTIKDELEETFYIGGWELYRKYDGSGGIDDEIETLHVMDDQTRVALVETATAHSVWSVPPNHTVQRFQLGNHLGTAMVELDEAPSGNLGIISYEEYHPYGTTAWYAENSGITARKKRYRYTQKERDAWTGLCYHGARYYMPWLGRWESADPAGMVDGPNRYAYVRGNPVSGRDPSGMGAVSDLWAKHGFSPRLQEAARALPEGSALQRGLKVYAMGAADTLAGAEFLSIAASHPVATALDVGAATTGVDEAAAAYSSARAGGASRVEAAASGIVAGATEGARLGLKAGTAGLQLAIGTGAMIGTAALQPLHSGRLSSAVWTGTDSTGDLQKRYGESLESTHALANLTAVAAIGGYANLLVKELDAAGAAGARAFSEELGVLESEGFLPRVAKLQGSPKTAPVPPVVYRGGTPSPSNLKTRPGEMSLSFRDSLSNPIDPATGGPYGGSPVFRHGKPWFGLDTSKLPAGSVVADGVPPGHVSVNPVGVDVLKGARHDRGKFPK